MQPECSNAINTRLWRAAKAGVVLELNWLLREPGVDVNWRHAGKDGSTALHVACSFGQTQAISLLLGARSHSNRTEI
jgi:ankyrin repeat protein